jgi:glutamyl-tRNA reductase
MSLLAVGLSYRTAPMTLLERSALTAAGSRELEQRLCRGTHVAEALVLATCNRLEVYAEVSRFHGGVADVGAALEAATGIELPDLTEHLYVHYEDAAVGHLFDVVCGLDSMALGEQQILGQVRTALRAAQDTGSVGRTLQPLFQHALRLGKRAHAETRLDSAGRSLVEAGLEGAAERVGPLREAHVLVVGAGSMSGLAVASVARAGAGRLTVTNRTRDRAERLAAASGGSVVPFDELPRALTDADVVISCTGAVGHVIDLRLAGAAHERRHGRPQAYVDLALPRDVEVAVADLDGVDVLDLEQLGHRLAAASATADLDDVRDLVAAEVEAFLAGRRAEAVAPTVTALRALARSVVEAELARLSGRLGDDVDGRVRAEVEQTVHRVVEKLLHTPTVRIKQLAGEPGGGSYAEALRELFDLDLGAVDAVSAVPGVVSAGPVGGNDVLSAGLGTGGAA